MNLQEFAALKVGDKIENLMNGHDAIGRVTETTDKGVKVRWLASAWQIFYSVQGTAWMHWSRVVEAIEERPDGIA